MYAIKTTIPIPPTPIRSLRELAMLSRKCIGGVYSHSSKPPPPRRRGLCSQRWVGRRPRLRGGVLPHVSSRLADNAHDPPLNLFYQSMKLGNLSRMLLEPFAHTRWVGGKTDNAKS